MPIPDPDLQQIKADTAWAHLMKVYGKQTPRRLRQVAAARAGLRALRGVR